MAANQSYRDDGGFQTNPTGSNTQNRNFLSPGAFQPQKISGITGTIAWTEIQDAWAIAGQTGVFGSVAWTETQDSWAISGSIRIDGSVAWTEIQDSWAISATVSGGGVTGDAAWVEIQDSWVGVGTTGVFAVAAWTEIQDAWNVVATLGVFGTAAWTEIQDSWNVVGTVSLPTLTGDVAWTEGQDRWNVQGTSGAQGGHFLPLTEKQLREIKKKHRKDAQLQRDLDHSRKLDRETIEADIRETMFPAGKEAGILPELTVERDASEDDDDEDDLIAILMNA